MTAPVGPASPGLSARDIRAAGLGPIDLDLSPNRLVVLEGPSGSGKSRLLRALVDLDWHEGSAWLDGRCRADMPAHQWRREVALLPAESHWWWPTVSAHLGACDVTAMLDALALPARLIDVPVDQLSTGERQRLAVVRLLCNRPRVLLLDEPTANLDTDSSARVEALISDYATATAASVLWVSHDPEQIRRLATRRLHMDAGALMEVTAHD